MYVHNEPTNNTGKILSTIYIRMHMKLQHLKNKYIQNLVAK